MVQLESTAQHLLLPVEALVGQAAAPSGDGLHLHVQQHREHGSAGGGVADAHFPDAQHRNAVGFRLRGGLHAHRQRLKGLRTGHGGLHRQIGGAIAHLAVDHVGTVDIGGDAHVVYGHVVAEGFRQRRHAGFAAGHVDRLLQGDGLGRTGHPLGHHAVVGGEHRHTALFYLRADLTRDARHADGHLLQPAKASRRLGKLRLTAACGGHGGLVRRSDGCDICVQFLLGHSVISPR